MTAGHWPDRVLDLFANVCPGTIQQTVDSRQQAVDSRQKAVDSKQKEVGTRTADSRQQYTVDSKEEKVQHTAG